MAAASKATVHMAAASKATVPDAFAEASPPARRAIPAAAKAKAAVTKAAAGKVGASKAASSKSSAKRPAPKADSVPNGPRASVKSAAPKKRSGATGTVVTPENGATTATPSPSVVKGAATGTQRKSTAKAKSGPYAADEKFLLEQRAMLESERKVYQGQATDLKAEADSLAQEREPGDVQFDEESGEGGTVTVDRERDLALSAQAQLAVEEIDEALARIKARTYGACERCQQPIPKPRLRALPYARLCVACKSGGLSRR